MEAEWFLEGTNESILRWFNSSERMDGCQLVEHESILRWFNSSERMDGSLLVEQLYSG